MLFCVTAAVMAAGLHDYDKTIDDVDTLGKYKYKFHVIRLLGNGYACPSFRG